MRIGRLASLFLSLLVLAIPRSGLSQAVWIQKGPGGGSDLKSIAIQPNNPDVAYLGGDIEGVFKTTDGGLTWKNVNANLATGPYPPDVYWVQEIVFDPADPSFQSVYLCSAIGLFKTTNGGARWTPVYPTSISAESDYLVISTMAIDPANPGNMFLGTGMTWSSASGKGVIYRTTNGGTSWQAIRVTPSDSAVIHDIEIDEGSSASTRTLFASTSEGVYKSLDNGTTWSPVNTGLPHLNARRMKAVRKDGKLTLILTLTTVGRSDNPSSYQGGVYRSTDAGGTWTSINGDLPRYQSGDSLSYFYWKFTVDPTNPEIIYVGTTRGWPRDDLAAYEEYGIYKTTNGGQSWRKVSTTVIDDWMDTGFYSERHAFVLELAPSEPEVIYWGLVWMKKSTDGGASWKQINSTKVGNAWETNGLELMVVDAITYHPVNPTVLYIGYDDFGIFRSDDGGRSFRPLDPKQDPFSGYDAAKDIAVDPSNGDLFVSRYEGLAFALANGFAKGGVWKSSDQGVAWTRLSNGLPDGTPKLIMDTTSGRSGSRTLYCTIYGSGVYKTTNGGASWGPSNNGLGADSSKAWEIALSPTNTNLLYLGLNALSGGGCYKSTDGGTSWRKLSSFPNHVVFGITIGPQNGFVYAATTDDFWYSTVGGVYRSTDGGTTWVQILDEPRIVGIEVHPKRATTLVALSQSWYQWLPNQRKGVLLSNDGGSTWSNISANLGNTYVRTHKFNPHNPEQILVGTSGGGLWMSSLALSSAEATEPRAMEYELQQNFPNPFNPSTTIRYRISRKSTVRLEIVDILGRKLDILVEGEQQAGAHERRWERDVPAGVYFARLTAFGGGNAGEGFRQVRRMLLIK